MDHVFERTGLLAGTTLIDKCKPAIRVYVMNTTEHDVELSKGMPIAKVSSISHVSTHKSTDFVEMHNLCMTRLDQCHYQPDDDIGVVAKERYHELTDDLVRIHTIYEPPKQVKTHSDEVGHEDMCYTGVEQDLHDNVGCPTRSNVASKATREQLMLDEYMRSVIQDIDIKGDELIQAVNLLKEYQDIFVGPDGKLGCTTACEGHRIDTGDTLPVRQRLYRVPPKRRKIIEDYVQELLAQGCIKPSSSDWATPVVIVNKKDGSPRFCLDYRKLNAVTRKDAFPLPRIDDALDQLAFKRYFCTFDLASGFYQLHMHPLDAHKTAFITHEGLYEWLILPMGLSNSPATFQHCMAQVLKGLIPDSCLAYLDEIIVFGDDFKDTMRNLRLVFDRLCQANLKLKPKKCRMFQSDVAYLGHIVSQAGIRTDPKEDRFHSELAYAN